MKKECWIYFLNPAFFLFKHNTQYFDTSENLHICVPRPHFMAFSIRKKQNQLIYDYQQQISFNFRVKNQDKIIFQSRKSTYNKF